MSCRSTALLERVINAREAKPAQGTTRQVVFKGISLRGIEGLKPAQTGLWLLPPRLERAPGVSQQMKTSIQLWNSVDRSQQATHDVNPGRLVFSSKQETALSAPDRSAIQTALRICRQLIPHRDN
jgi:hypothetical protein